MPPKWNFIIFPKYTNLHMKKEESLCCGIWVSLLTIFSISLHLETQCMHLWHNAFLHFLLCTIYGIYTQCL